jgi:hypothetical protein
MTKTNSVLNACNDFCSAVEEKECAIAIYDATGKKLGYVADIESTENVFFEGMLMIDKLTITEDKSKALRIKWTKDEKGDYNLLKIKDRLTDAVDALYDFGYSGYLFELAD